MADTKPVVVPAPRKGRRWLKILGWVFGLFLLLLVVAYFVGTSAAFVKGVVLPKVSSSLGADITVSDATISPFKQVIFKDFKLQAKGEEPLLVCPEVRARYSLMDIIHGRINVDEVLITSPVIQLVEKADGTSNLDPITRAQKEKSASEKQKKESPAKSSEPPRIDLKKLSITGATVRQVKLYKGTNRDLTELSNAGLTVENIKNGAAGKITLEGDLSVESNPPAPGTNGTFQAKVNGNFGLSLANDLKPASIQGKLNANVVRASGSFSEAALLASELACDVTPTEIKQVALRLQKGSTPLGQIVASGPFNIEKSEGKLTVQVLSINKQVLNLIGAKQSLDFGSTTITSTNQIELAKSGQQITASGQFNMDKFQVTRTNQTTPTLDLIARYDVTVDTSAKSATLRQFTVNGIQKGNALLKAELTSPMIVAWGNATSAVGDSALKFTISNFDFADWKPFIGELAPAGILNAQAQVTSQQAGKLVAFDMNSQIANLTATLGSNRLTQAGVIMKVAGKATDLKQFNLSDLNLQLLQQNQPVLNVEGSGTYNTENKGADMQLTMRAFLARFLQVMPQQDVSVSSGAINLKTHLVQKQETQSVSGTFTLSEFSGKFGKTELSNFEILANLDVVKSPQKIQINKVSGTFSNSGKAGGSFDLNGTFDPTNKSTQLTAKLADVNQNGLGPFLQSALEDKKLVSVSLNGNASVQYDPMSASKVNGNFNVSNLVVHDPKGEIPEKPLEARLQVDASLNKAVADIKTLQIGFTPTPRATNNSLTLSGRVDMSQTNATTGVIKLSADTLDVTTYYDLFATGTADSKNPAAASTQEKLTKSASVGPGEPEKEPEPKKLPFRNFVTEATIGHFYLREVEIGNFQFVTKIDGGHILVNPAKLTLNNAPVESAIDLDMEVPGYKYNVSFKARGIPLTPLVNSFSPERKGQLGGTMSADTKIAGQGITGASLQKNLTGQFDFNSTNLNLSVVNIKQPVIKLIVNVVANIPEIIHNPTGGALSLLEGVTGLGGGGLMGELKKSPIDTVAARGSAGAGKVELQQAAIVSPAFRADANGTVTLAPVLTNSAITLPVIISLSRPLAEKAGMSVDTNSSYAKLPDFLLIGGTVGSPKADKRKMLVLATAGVKGILNAIPGTGNAGSLVNQLGGLLSGGSQTATNATGANQTNKSNNLLQGLNSLLGGAAGANTNTPPGSNTTATNQSPVNNLLNDLLKPKKK